MFDVLFCKIKYYIPFVSKALEWNDIVVGIFFLKFEYSKFSTSMCREKSMTYFKYKSISKYSQLDCAVVGELVINIIIWVLFQTL